MRYKLHCHIIFLCVLIFLVHILTMARATYSANTLMNSRDQALQPRNAFQKKRNLPCDSCGNECSSACGTKNFRTCCFNYLRKRNDPNTLKLINSSNKHLIDFILLQGHAMYTLNEHKRARNANNNIDATGEVDNDNDDDDNGVDVGVHGVGMNAIDVGGDDGGVGGGGIPANADPINIGHGLGIRRVVL